MKKILRKGLNVNGAFRSGWIKNKSFDQSNDDVLEANIHQDPSLEPPLISGTTAEDFGNGQPTTASEEKKSAKRSFLKRYLRQFVSYIYRKIVKPISRPIAFRLRRYLLDGLRQEMQREIWNASAASANQAQMSLRAMPLATTNGILQEDFKNLLNVLRQQIRDDLHNTSMITAQELQKSHNELISEKSIFKMKEINNLFNSMMDDIHNLSFDFNKLIRELNQRLNFIEHNAIGMENINDRLIQVDKIKADVNGILRGVHDLNSTLTSRLDLLEQYGSAAAGRYAVYCGEGEILVRTQVGFLICGATDHALLACLIDTGDLERGTRFLIEKYLMPGDVYVDVGANVGMHTLAAARAMQGRGKIIAFEPFEPTMRMLEKTVWINGFSTLVELHQAAASNSVGRHKLFIGATSGHHSLFELDASAVRSVAEVEVPLVRLDGIIAPYQRIDLLKIDAEGAELDVIEGGASLIRANSDMALIVEFGPSHLRRTGHSADQWLNVFQKFGFDYRVINAETGVLEEVTVAALEQMETANLFFAMRGSSAWGRLA